jgi:hypothetical protein
MQCGRAPMTAEVRPRADRNEAVSKPSGPLPSRRVYPQASEFPVRSPGDNAKPQGNHLMTILSGSRRRSMDCSLKSAAFAVSEPGRSTMNESKSVTASEG